MPASSSPVCPELFFELGAVDLIESGYPQHSKYTGRVTLVPKVFKYDLPWGLFGAPAYGSAMCTLLPFSLTFGLFRIPYLPICEVARNAALPQFGMVLVGGLGFGRRKGVPDEKMEIADANLITIIANADRKQQDALIFFSRPFLLHCAQHQRHPGRGR